MRPFSNILFWLSLIALAFFAGCSNEDEYIPGLEGNMVGYVYTYDEFGYPLDNHEKVRIKAFGHVGNYVAYSNPDGRFELLGVPAGTYELHFEKDGFGMLKKFGVQHLGGKPTLLFPQGYTYYYIYAFIIYEMPETDIVHVRIENDTLYGEFAFKDIVYPDQVCLRIFFSTSPDFTKETSEFTGNYKLWKKDGLYTRRMYYSDMNFPPGETVFYKACIYAEPASIYHFSSQLPDNYIIVQTDTYFDIQTNELIYPNLGDESEVFSFIFPE